MFSTKSEYFMTKSIIFTARRAYSDASGELHQLGAERGGAVACGRRLASAAAATAATAAVAAAAVA